MAESAREMILNRLDQSADIAEGNTDEQGIQENAQRLIEQSIHATLLSDNLTEAFCQRIKRGHVIGTTCDVVDSTDEIPAAVADYLATNELDFDIAVQQAPIFDNIHWGPIKASGAELDGLEDGLVAVSTADFGIAETSSVVFHSGENNPVLINFLSFHLIIVIKAETILATLDDYATMADTDKPVSKTVWITGASGTADIEAVLVQGAHGPCQVHIIVVN